MLTRQRDVVAVIQRMGVGVSVGSSVSFHVYVNKGLYREWGFFNLLTFFFLN